MAFTLSFSSLFQPKLNAHPSYFMTRIDFYIIPQNQPEQVSLFACKLIEKIYRSGHKIMVKVDDKETAEALDKQLWEYKPESFIPHKILDNSSEVSPDTSILISYDSLGNDYEVLVNLSSEVPLEFTRFERVTQIASQYEPQRLSSREHYKFYKDRGYPLHNHDLRK